MTKQYYINFVFCFLFSVLRTRIAMVMGMEFQIHTDLWTCGLITMVLNQCTKVVKTKKTNTVGSAEIEHSGTTLMPYHVNRVKLSFDEMLQKDWYDSLILTSFNHPYIQSFIQSSIHLIIHSIIYTFDHSFNQVVIHILQHTSCQIKTEKRKLTSADHLYTFRYHLIQKQKLSKWKKDF